MDRKLPRPSFRSLFLLFLALASSTAVYATTTCNVLHYGGIADNVTDIGPAITKAYKECVSKAITSDPADTILLVPQGSYAIKTNVSFYNGSYFTMKIDGKLNLLFNPKLGGNIFLYARCRHAVWKGTGAIYGNGHLWRPNEDLGKYPNRPRLLRFEHCDNVDVSGVTLYNAPRFHVVIVGNDNVVHNMKIIADHIGTTDGIDVSGNNNYVHDVSVENGDECVTVKSPTDGFFAENIQCFYSTGNNIGSFGKHAKGASVQNVYYRNVTHYRGEGGIILKSYPSASGVVKNVTYEDFALTDVARPILITDFWCPHVACPGTSGDLVWKNITFRRISGTGDSNTKRHVIEVRCISGHECTGIVFEDVKLTKEGGAKPTTLISNACGAGLPGLKGC